MSGPFSGGQPTGNGYSSPQWSDNVGRMHAFMARFPAVKITVPRENGTRDFIAMQDGVELGRDTSLGWLMDQLEKRFPRDLPLADGLPGELGWRAWKT